ncbi:biotin transporter BioY [Desulfotomaculum copahuensis]|uniref:Biotin transporter n=1 Tax=Desulfotomaculum copahuensis TaxID=1838280 RepID=A0A1B7LCR0_9FIRM|nr:biotin transporter BioY [Desulfotomaculum copahuensis]OAT80701.1 biotin biosynthesis protein BioY [Desulfotomaculum copahuensis]
MKMSPREMVLAALFAALCAVAAALVRFGGAVVPFSLVPFVVMLAGALLGARAGALSILVYVLLGLSGLPVFEKPPFGGPAYVLQPTFGFLPGFIAGAFVIGALLPRRREPGLWRYLPAMVAGLAVIYLVGLPYLYLILNFYLGKAVSAAQVIKIGFLPFIGFDLLKAVVAAGLARLVVRRLGDRRAVPERR